MNLLYCNYCGKELPSPDADICTQCGKLVIKKASQTSPEIYSGSEGRLSRAWYLLPIFFGIIGGVISYFVLKNKDSKLAKNCLWIGIIITVISIGVALASTVVQSALNVDNPLKQCINNKETHYKISATLEITIDGKKQEIPANVGFSQGCQRALYTLSNNGVIYAEWTKKYPFEVGHFLWIWNFPLRDMDETKSRVLVNGVESPDFIHTPLEQGAHYKVEFISKAR